MLSDHGLHSKGRVDAVTKWSIRQLDKATSVGFHEKAVYRVLTVDVALGAPCRWLALLERLARSQTRRRLLLAVFLFLLDSLLGTLELFRCCSSAETCRSMP